MKLEIDISINKENKKSYGAFRAPRVSHTNSAMRFTKKKKREHLRNQNRNNLELKDMRKLSRNDEAFHLSSTEICDIVQIIISRKTPTPKRYQRWDEYAISFYLKMCTCFAVDYQHLEATTSEDHDCRKKQLLSPSSTIEMSSSKGQEEHMDRTTKGVSLEDLVKKIREEKHIDEGISRKRRKKLEAIKFVWRKPIYLRGPYKMGSYSPGTEPDHIPYDLYLLVKEAVHIMRRYNDPNDLVDLKIAEKKIRFFCTYFNSHLPTGWKYNRANASSLIAGYDPMGGNRCFMAGYTPFRDWAEAEGCDRKTYLSPRGIADIMSIIHSRKTPTFWGMSWGGISFYCKLCSCFGIDYQHLEAACEDNVCLMNTGRDG